MYYKNIFLAKGWLIAFTVLIFCTSVQAQRRFQGGVVVGLSASQIDGDLMAGYDKLGLIGGIRTVARLKERSDLSVEFLFKIVLILMSLMLKESLEKFSCCFLLFDLNPSELILLWLNNVATRSKPSSS